MGPRVDQVSSLLLRRKEYIRRKNQGISNVNERELILTHAEQLRISVLQPEPASPQHAQHPNPWHQLSGQLSSKCPCGCRRQLRSVHLRAQVLQVRHQHTVLGIVGKALRVPGHILSAALFEPQRLQDFVQHHIVGQFSCLSIAKHCQEPGNTISKLGTSPKRRRRGTEAKK